MAFSASTSYLDCFPLVQRAGLGVSYHGACPHLVNVMARQIETVGLRNQFPAGGVEDIFQCAGGVLAMFNSLEPSFPSMCSTGMPQASVTVLLVRTWFSSAPGVRRNAPGDAGTGVTIQPLLQRLAIFGEEIPGGSSSTFFTVSPETAAGCIRPGTCAKRCNCGRRQWRGTCA
jgi:hypothetical protein